jgi:predicted unusual protein kinase regulating ubiquinone biosynthesis (AarF/ABC1/UbiB family)
MSEIKKEFKSIPTSKVSRAMKVLGTGMKVGGNYVAHYSKNAIGIKESKDQLNEKNAETVFSALGEMKGSALKMAQMLSMDEFTLPESFQSAFEKAQHNAPPLSFPLVEKTFRSQFNQEISALFTSFTKQAIHAASIGQVHEAYQGNKKYAVKIQYPGVADSIESDLKLMKPIAQKMLNVSSKELEFYLEEVKNTLLEETDYIRELTKGLELKKKCENIPNLIIPQYHKDLSSKRILTMDYIEGTTLTEWLKSKPSLALKQKVAQTIWDTFLYQLQELKLMHADPHPGNFIITDNAEVCLIDFGCVKEVKQEFHDRFFMLLRKDVLENEVLLKELMWEFSYLSKHDSEEEQNYLYGIIKDSMELIAIPFWQEKFDFGSWDYMKGLYSQGEEMAVEFRKRKLNSARGPREGIYLLRTFYGLYMILAKLGAEVHLNYPIVKQ